MPIFKWFAIDLAGQHHKGLDFAMTESELVVVLQHRQLGLMSSWVESHDFSQERLALAQQVNFFNDLLTLLNAGLPLPQVLQLFLNQSKQPKIRCMVGYLLYRVQQQGEGFGVAFDRLKPIFGNLVVVVLQAGFNVGNLVVALQQISSYLEHNLNLQRELKKALLMPGLTLILFIIITLILFLVIVPHFATVFSQADLPLTSSTKIVIALSEFLRSTQALVALLTASLVTILLISLVRHTTIKKVWQRFLLKLPVLGNLIQCQNLFSFLQAAALLIQGGATEVEALAAASNAMNNYYLRQQCQLVTQLVEQGTAISFAMQRVNHHFFTNELIGMIAVGEESATLGLVLARASQIFQQRFKARLQFLLVILQPTLILALGLMVALLIFAIYVPIFNMPALMD